MEADWITAAQAADIVGCSRHTIDRHVSAGRIARRYPVGRKTPSLNRESVEEFAKWWSEHQRATEQRRRPPLPPGGPPDDGDVWLDSVTASLVVGVTRQYLCRLAAGGRLRVVPDRRRRKYWFRRRDIEQFAAIRALRAQYSLRS